MSNYIESSSKLVDEGMSILEHTGLLNALSKYGQPTLGGSIVYNTMVERDIDIVVTTDENLTVEIRNRLCYELIRLKNCVGIKMVDRMSAPKDGRPRGFWIMPEILCGDKSWAIDIWLINVDELSVVQDIDLDKRMRLINDTQREKILTKKIEAIKLGTKKKGVTSVEIYREVIGIS